MTPDDLQVQACEFWQQFPPEERPGEGERVELVRNKAGELQAFWGGCMYGVRNGVAYRWRMVGSGRLEVTVWRHGERCEGNGE